jgi:hsp70-interacting protein
VSGEGLSPALSQVSFTDFAAGRPHQLVEGIDNANDLQNMGLWPKIASLLTSSSDLVRRHAAWVCGTAIQNNAKSQAAVRPSGVLQLSLVSIAEPSSTLLC